MKSEDKQLLITDLSARLPYGVICKTSKGNGHLCSINQHIFGIEYGINIKATERDYFNDEEEIKPYLRPMSSMTEEEKEELKELTTADIVTGHGFAYKNLEGMCFGMRYIDCQELIDWFNEHHFDHRGLIDKGLAIEVTEDNNPYKD